MTDELKPLERRMIRRMESVKGSSVLELWNWVEEHDLDPAEVTITFAHIVYHTPETDEEQAQHLKHVLESDRRKEAWEREAIVRLAEKYGYALVPKTERTDNAVDISDPGQWPNVG